MTASVSNSIEGSYTTPGAPGSVISGVVLTEVYGLEGDLWVRGTANSNLLGSGIEFHAKLSVASTDTSEALQLSTGNLTVTALITSGSNAFSITGLPGDTAQRILTKLDTGDAEGAATLFNDLVDNLS